RVGGAVADHRDAAAAGVAQLGEKVDLLDALAELFLVGGHFVEQLGVRHDDEPPLLGRDPNRVDVPEPAVVVELCVVVVQDVEVREPLPVRHEPADRVPDLHPALALAGPRAGAPRGPGGAAAGTGAGAAGALAPMTCCSSWPASRNAEEPKLTMSPSDRAASVTGSPLTKVPFELPRSPMRHAPASLRSS